MAMLYRLPNLVTVEHLPESYVSGIGMVEALGTNLRITLYVERFIGGDMMPVPEVAFIGPMAGLPDAVGVLQQSAGSVAALAWNKSWRLLGGSQHH